MHVVTQVITWSKLEIISVLRLKRPITVVVSSLNRPTEIVFNFDVHQKMLHLYYGPPMSWRQTIRIHL